MNGKNLIILAGVLAVSCLVNAQTNNNAGGPVFTVAEKAHDFGTIGENDGDVEHIFKFKNTGNAPLVVTNVQVTCGCTQPEWSKEPVLPGKEGFIIIRFVPKGALGPFTKPAFVNTNEDDGYKRHRLDITGIVVEKPGDPGVPFLHKFGGMGIENKNLTLRSYNTASVNIIPAYIKNYNNETAYFTWENIPAYITIKAPDSLKADWPGEILFSVDGPKTANKRGRVAEKCTWVVKNKDGKLLGREVITITINYIDDFNRLSPVQMVSAPSLDIKTTIIDFGAVKAGALGIGGTVNKPIILSNIGKSDLIIHSMTGEDERVHLPALKGTTIKAGESLTVNATIRTKEFNAEKLDTEIFVVCNDPKGPVRRIKVTAEKIN